MLNIEKVIDEYNENVLEDKIVEELRKEFQSKLHDGEEDTKIEVSTNADYMRVLDGTEDNIDTGVLTVASTLDSDDSYTTISTTIEDYATIKEHDQRRKVIFNKRELLESLGLYELATTYPSDSTVELKVTIVGRDCDRYGHPIDID